MLIDTKKLLIRLGPGSLALMFSLFTATAARATMMAPGSGPVVTPGTASFSGLTLVAGADEIVPFIGVDVFNNVKFSGTLESRVYHDPSGSLDFAYQINAAPTGPDSIHSVSISSYSTFDTNVDYIPSTGAVTYGSANRLSVAAGEIISFNYTALANSIAPGDSTDWILVKTNAFAFNNLGDTSVIDGGTADVVSFQPVPEPASLGLLTVCCGALLTRRSRSRT
ncbi:MAG: PEP-CTERM sorting domain-containing protein [Planctomycetota bacterium]|nr:PEP-CTERM sorting domain-containing protein [Planctomycetota bacterium]